MNNQNLTDFYFIRSYSVNEIQNFHLIDIYNCHTYKSINDFNYEQPTCDLLYKSMLILIKWEILRLAQDTISANSYTHQLLFNYDSIHPRCSWLEKQEILQFLSTTKKPRLNSRSFSIKYQVKLSLVLISLRQCLK